MLEEKKNLIDEANVHLKLKKDEISPLELRFNILTYKISIFLDKIYPGIHPNVITTFGLISAIFLVFRLNSLFIKFKLSSLLYASVLFFINRTCDLLDGIIARKHNKSSKFGYYYDHGVDIFLAVSVIYLSLKHKLFDNSITIANFLLFLVSVLQTLRELIFVNNKLFLRYTRYFDHGFTYFIFVPIWICFQLMKKNYNIV